MADARLPLRVPVGADAERWITFRGRRTVVAATRTVTSTTRLLETLPALVRNDRRVSVVFSHDASSAFNDGVDDLLTGAGCRVMPWSQLPHAAPDLIISATENLVLPDDGCPVLVLPHGVGFQKSVPDSRTPRTRLSGVVPDRLLASGRAWMAVSHPAQEEQLLSSHPKAAGRTVLVGDPVLDELLTSNPRAADYRHTLGVPDGARLVVVSSTWGRTSLLGRHPDLPARLLAGLPYDAYRVALIVHPNVWAAHGAWQVRALLADALDAGLLLVPPVHAWRSALVAADAVIGDHGSVTLYAAALGKPVLLGAFGADSVPGTAIARLAGTAPRLDVRGGLREQLETHLAEHVPGRYADVAAAAFAQPGNALTRLRGLFYELLRLPEPDTGPPPSNALPPPDRLPSAVTSWSVATRVGQRDGRWVVAVSRCPAVLRADDEQDADDSGEFTHLASDEAERDTRVSQSATVIVRHESAPTAVAAVRWIRDALTRFPGAYLAASAMPSGGCLVGLRDGRVLEASATGPATDAGLPAAVVYCLLRAGVPFDGMLAVLRVDGRPDADVALRLRPGCAG